MESFDAVIEELKELDGDEFAERLGSLAADAAFEANPKHMDADDIEAHIDYYREQSGYGGMVHATEQAAFLAAGKRARAFLESSLRAEHVFAARDWDMPEEFSEEEEKSVVTDAICQAVDFIEQGAFDSYHNLAKRI